MNTYLRIANRNDKCLIFYFIFHPWCPRCPKFRGLNIKSHYLRHDRLRHYLHSPTSLALKKISCRVDNQNKQAQLSQASKYDFTERVCKSYLNILNKFLLRTRLHWLGLSSRRRMNVSRPLSTKYWFQKNLRIQRRGPTVTRRLIWRTSTRRSWI